MEYKEAVKILIRMLNKYRLDKDEKQAVETAIGVLDWAALGKNRLKSIIKYRKEKKEKGIQW